MAKPTPALWPVRLAMAVFMPIKRPWELSSGPPELPGLTAASIWMIDLIDRVPRTCSERLRLETMPVVIVRSRPNGLPMAKTAHADCISAESPSESGNRTSRGASILITAISLLGSAPTELGVVRFCRRTE